MFPLRDVNPTIRQPVATVTLIGVNVLAWTFVQGFGDAVPLVRSLCLYGLIPGDLFGLTEPGTVVPMSQNLGCKLTGQATGLTMITHMFLHGGWFHLLSNMWFLWVFGDNIEDVMGAARFVIFYLICGLAAATAQIATDPATTMPMVGASGAIGGVLGAYARLFPRVHIVLFIFLGIFWTTATVPAFVMLGYWFILQLIGGVPALQGSGTSVAFWAHIGGFVTGLMLSGLMARRDYLSQHYAHMIERNARHRLF